MLCFGERACTRPTWPLGAKQRDSGALAAFSRKRGRKPGLSPEEQEIARLRAEVARLETRLAQTEKIIEVQEKLSALQQALDEQTR